MAKVIAVSNQKGGVGKTNASVNLGIGLARQGKKTLIIDADPQASLTTSLGWREPNKLTITLTTVMIKIMTDKAIDGKEGILKHSEGVDILPANMDLSGLEMSLVTAMSRETILRQYIDKIKHEYEYIITDTCPSLGMLTVNALAAANSVIIPVQAQYLSLKGLEQLLQTIANVKRQINPGLTIEDILITMTNMRTKYNRDIITLLEESYKGKIKIFSKSIPQSVRVSETSVEGISIYAHDPNGKAALAYERLTTEVLRCENE